MFDGRPTFPTFYEPTPTIPTAGAYLVQCPKCGVFYVPSITAVHLCSTPVAFTWSAAVAPPPGPTRAEFDALARRVQELEAKVAALAER